MDRGIFADRLREAMGDMSSIDLADKLGCNKSVVSLYLSKQRTPSKMAVQLMALVLSVNPAWLYGLDVPKEPTVKIVPIKKSPGAEESAPRDEREAEIISLVRRLDDAQKDMILLMLRPLAAQKR